MNAATRRRPPAWKTVALTLLTLAAAAPALAGEAGDWRPTYDLIMRWVNFLILAFLIVKFSRVPLGNFLSGRREEIAEQIEELESRRNEAAARVEEMRRQAEEGARDLEALQKRLAAQGERHRREIVASAEKECELMMAASRAKIQAEIRQTRSTVRDEMIDAAVDMATARLPAAITPADGETLLSRYLEETGSR